jgi:hypothetical protein
VSALGEGTQPFPPDPAQDAAVDLFLDTFPDATVIAACGYDERGRAFRYAAERREQQEGHAQGSVSGQRALDATSAGTDARRSPSPTDSGHHNHRRHG